MSVFLVSRRQAGPEWDPARPMEEQAGWREHAAFMDSLVERGFIVLGGPIAGGPQVVIAVETASDDEVRSTLAQDPWSESHLLLEWVEPWMIRLDGRTVQPGSESKRS